MSKTSLRIVVSGLIAQYPLGGVTWDYLQYVLGLARMGHDVYYLEDTGQWPYNPGEDGVSAGCDFNVAYLAGVMAHFGLADRWAYRFPWEDRWYGLSDRERLELEASADLVLNVSGVLRDPWRFRRATLAFIDSDPVFTQIKLLRGQDDFRRYVDSHDVHFSFGECISGSRFETGHNWIPTRQPIVIDEWESDLPTRSVFTTVLNWTSYKPVRHAGETYGQKDVELSKFMALPQVVGPVLELAISSGKTRRTPHGLLARSGWQLVDPNKVCATFGDYRTYVSSSMAEWSVAKNGYVAGAPGWFSCRSACYLAAGRPVVVQDTGFSDVLPTGDGILAFSTLDEAAAGIERVVADPSGQGRTAREIAHEHFEASRVLQQLVDRASGTRAAAPLAEAQDA